MRFLNFFIASFLVFNVNAQETFYTNGVADKRANCYAFTNATIVQDASTTIANATLLIRDGKIVAVGENIVIPKDAVTLNCTGKFIYPSFIDIYSDYGIAIPQGTQTPFSFGIAQFNSNTKGAYGWNQALKPEVDGYKIFNTDESKAKQLREVGFGTVLTHQKDGIIRGTGTVVTLANSKENLVIVKDKASQHLSFAPGTSTQSYPSSLMGVIALLRQTYLDAAWYKSKPSSEGINISLQSFNSNQTLPQIIEPMPRGNNEVWNVLRANRIAKEFGLQYIIKATGKEYQRINEIAATKSSMIVSLNFPLAQDIEDPNDARLISLADMKHWELAPSNPAVLEKAGINFALTAADVRDTKTFISNLRKSMDYGLSEKTALEALTKNPANMLGVYANVGSIEAGKLANFIITDGNIFNEKTTIHYNYVQGEKYVVKEDNWFHVNGSVYDLVIDNKLGETSNYKLEIKSATEVSLLGKDTMPVKFTYDGKMVKLSFAPATRKRGSFANNSRNNAASPTVSSNSTRLSGINNGNVWQGIGVDSVGNTLNWKATLVSSALKAVDSAKLKQIPKLGEIVYPFAAYGVSTSSLPKQETILFKNATVWTSEKEPVLLNTDVLLKDGKIEKIGKNLEGKGAKIIDATDKFLTAGIIDEHSHIAVASINEGGQTITSEVRIKDNLDPDDINIYRQLSGGVTSAHILHGSANTIGGQTQLIKLRWGRSDEDLQFKDWSGFIKFALGENVKRTASAQGNNRFPDTRMGVEQVLIDAFTRAKEYENSIKAYEIAVKTNPNVAPVRRNLELDALVEILNSKRFITCHSYVQSEITSTMRVAEKFGFKVNTFTHILEGYKVADKMKLHGANAGTFSDWWAYKLEVQDAIPYNPGIMNNVGVNVAINSDDAEMARRLNQEAAKSVKYSNVSEAEAWKMVTINAAKMLRVDDKVGSIKAGKDADVVLWSDNPLSIYSKALYTIVDGIIYFDREKDMQLRKDISNERLRLQAKMLGEKREGRSTVPATPSYKYISGCLDHGHKLGMLEIELDEE